jgi:hypothetical protein
MAGMQGEEQAAAASIVRMGCLESLLTPYTAAEERGPCPGLQPCCTYEKVYYTQHNAAPTAAFEKPRLVVCSSIEPRERGAPPTCAL